MPSFWASLGLTSTDVVPSHLGLRLRQFLKPAVIRVGAVPDGGVGPEHNFESAGLGALRNAGSAIEPFGEIAADLSTGNPAIVQDWSASSTRNRRLYPGSASKPSQCRASSGPVCPAESTESRELICRHRADQPGAAEWLLFRRRPSIRPRFEVVRFRNVPVTPLGSLIEAAAKPNHHPSLSDCLLKFSEAGAV